MGLLETDQRTSHPEAARRFADEKLSAEEIDFYRKEFGVLKEIDALHRILTLDRQPEALRGYLAACPKAKDTISEALQLQAFARVSWMAHADLIQLTPTMREGRDPQYYRDLGAGFWQLASRFPTRS